jgi:hypothetical protein
MHSCAEYTYKLTCAIRYRYEWRVRTAATPVVDMTSYSAPFNVGQSEVPVSLNGVFRIESRACRVWTSTRYARMIFALTRSPGGRFDRHTTVCGYDWAPAQLYVCPKAEGQSGCWALMCGDSRLKSGGLTRTSLAHQLFECPPGIVNWCSRFPGCRAVDVRMEKLLWQSTC